MTFPFVPVPAQSLVPRVHFRLHTSTSCLCQSNKHGQKRFTSRLLLSGPLLSQLAHYMPTRVSSKSRADILSGSFGLRPLIGACALGGSEAQKLQRPVVRRGKGSVPLLTQRLHPRRGTHSPGPGLGSFAAREDPMHRIHFGYAELSHIKNIKCQTAYCIQ